MSNSNKSNRIISKDARKSQRKALQEALKKDKSQGAALRTLKRLEKEYKDVFKLSEFQRAILSNQDLYFKAVQSTYTPTMEKKVEQIERKRNNKEPLTKTKFYITYKNGEYTFKIKGTFDTKKEAKEAEKELTVSNTEIHEQTREIPTTFTPNEMLGRLQQMEKKFYASYEKAEFVTLGMVNTSLNIDNTEKDEELNDKSKVKFKKAS